MESNEYLGIQNYLKSQIFNNKNIILTGGTGTIGSEVLKKLLLCGAKVLCFVHNMNKINPDLNKYVDSNQLKYLQIDFNEKIKITQKFQDAMLYLKGRLDILIFCHGKFYPGEFIKVGNDSFDSNININVRANFHILSLAVPFLKLTKGNVVMISSMETKIVEKGDFLQALSKSMINSLVENSALELASYGIRVNAVAPSFIRGDYRIGSLKGKKNDDYLIQMKNFSLLGKRLIEPEEVADTILFLASNEAKFMTGEIITMDCGFELNHDLSFQQE